MKGFIKIILAGLCGALFSVVAIFLLACHYQTTPVAFINSNPDWKGWQQERYQFGMNNKRVPQPAQV